MDNGKNTVLISKREGRREERRQGGRKGGRREEGRKEGKKGGRLFFIIYTFCCGSVVGQ